MKEHKHATQRTSKKTKRILSSAFIVGVLAFLLLVSGIVQIIPKQQLSSEILRF